MIKRIIPCIDYYNDRIVKGINFNNLLDIGDPISVSLYYNNEGADELVMLDISANLDNKKKIVKYINKINSKINIPLIIGGGIKTINDVKIFLNSGADKVSLNTSIINDFNMVSDIKNIYGSQCIVIAIDYKKNIFKNFYNLIIYKNSGKINTLLTLYDLIINYNNIGIGEFLLTSIDKDGTNNGYDLEVISKISKISKNSIIVSGGLGSYKDLLNIFKIKNINAVLGASIFHSKKYSIFNLKNFLFNNGYNIKF